MVVPEPRRDARNAEHWVEQLDQVWVEVRREGEIYLSWGEYAEEHVESGPSGNSRTWPDAAFEEITGPLPRLLHQATPEDFPGDIAEDNASTVGEALTSRVQLSVELADAVFGFKCSRTEALLRMGAVPTPCTMEAYLRSGMVNYIWSKETIVLKFPDVAIQAGIDARGAEVLEHLRRAVFARAATVIAKAAIDVIWRPGGPGYLRSKANFEACAARLLA